MIYGYARVSSKGQFRDGNSLEDQKAQLLKAGCQTVIEEQYTGTTIDRPEFSKLIEKLCEGDTLIVTKLDRFARNAGDGSNLAKEVVAMTGISKSTIIRAVRKHRATTGNILDTTEN